MKLYYSFLVLFFLVGCKKDEPLKVDNFNIPAIQFQLKGKADSSVKDLSFLENGEHDIYFNCLNSLKYKNFKVSKSNSPNVEFLEAVSTEKAGFYKIEITESKVIISTNDEQGKFNALSALSQALSLNGFLKIGEISSVPRFQYRGMHLDVCRHFFSVDEVKSYIDFLFFYGYNKFHWHLTEDQGWRIEIKQYPKLQEVAAFRDETLIGHYNEKPHRFDGKKYGGFYTQEEVKEVVKYASEKGIEIIPEIEMPGHSLAALAAYPEIGCEEKAYKAGTKWGVFDDIYCPTENTFTFLENVLDEVMMLFPSQYIHIGGDEAPKKVWRESAFCQALIEQEGLGDEEGLQSYFIKRIERYVNAKGKSIIGWDEIIEGGIAPNATIMSWRGNEGGIKAANEKHDVIMTPTSHCYFDYYLSNGKDEPLAIGGFLPVSKVYDFNPIPKSLKEDKKDFIIGAQGNVWTEYMPSFDQVEYMALTRMAALSEVLWLESEDKDFDSFKTRLSKHIDFWLEKGVNVADHRLNIDPKILTKFGQGPYVDMGAVPNGSTIQFVSPTQKLWSPVEGKRFELTEAGFHSFRAINGEKEGRSFPFFFTPHKATNASLLLKNPPAEQYGGNGASSLINGVVGDNDKYSGSEWLGFSGVDLDAEIIFPDIVEVNSIDLRFFSANGQWIYLPKEIEVLTSTNGKSYTSIKKVANMKSRSTVANLKFDFKNVKTKYLKIKALNRGRIPKGSPGEGQQAWLFVDEIIIN